MAVPRYTLHEHRARRAGLHYDLRLQKGNDVYSFALPKAKLPDDKKVFLAVLSHVDRNDLSALDFIGSIPDGNYGAGNLSILETGKYIILDWPTDNSKIIFEVPKQFGLQDLVGRYYLVKTSQEKNYVFGKSTK
jgi:bifunctional non-homologous end joining protein LigD